MVLGLFWTSEHMAMGQSADIPVEEMREPMQVPAADADGDVQVPAADADGDVQVPAADADGETSSRGCDEAQLARSDEWVLDLAEGGLVSLGFEVVERDFSMRVRAGRDAASLTQVVGQDEALVQLLSLYRELKHVEGVALDGALDASLEAFFDAENAGVSAHDKMLILATILPSLIEHARLSGTFTRAKKLDETMRSVELRWPNRRFDILCTMADSVAEARMQFPIERFAAEGNVTVTGGLRCAQMDSGAGETRAVVEGLRCRVVEAVRPADPMSLENALTQTLQGLVEIDNDVIVSGMGQILDGLVLRSQKTDLASKWKDGWTDADVESWMCRMMSIELMALEQHRYVEVSRLERQIASVFPGATFYKRLTIYMKCAKDKEAAFAQAYSRLMQDHHGEYAWVVQHFAAKARKKLDKSFQAWTRKISKSVEIYRRLLAGLVLWSERDYKKAASCIGDVGENRSIIAHPQLYSLNLLLRAVRGEGLDQESLAYFTRVMLLKVPALMYQTLAEAGQFLSNENRRQVVAAVRQYVPSLVSREIARFYLIYEKEFRAVLSASQRVSFDLLLDDMFGTIASEAERSKRWQQWYGDLLDAGDWAGIAALGRRVSLDTAADERWRVILAVAALHAAAVAEQRPASVDDAKLSSDYPDLAGCLSKKTAKLSGLELSKAWLKQLRVCLGK